MLEHRARLEKAHRDTGVAPEYVVAIIGVETFYGRITGKYRVLDALTTLAFDYTPRADFFRGELAQFIALTREESIDPLTAMGSYAGAMGASQFMPSSYRRYAVDGSNDKHRDLFSDWDDIIASVANYFKEHGWVTDGPVLADAVLQPDAPVVADPGNLVLNETIAGLKSKGVDFDPESQGADTPVLLVPAETQLGPSYRVGFKNFEVITPLQPQRALCHGGNTTWRRPSPGESRSPMRKPRSGTRPRSWPRAPPTTKPPSVDVSCVDDLQPGARHRPVHRPRGLQPHAPQTRAATRRHPIRFGRAAAAGQCVVDPRRGTARRTARHARQSAFLRGLRQALQRDGIQRRLGRARHRLVVWAGLPCRGHLAG